MLRHTLSAVRRVTVRRHDRTVSDSPRRTPIRSRLVAGGVVTGVVAALLVPAASATAADEPFVHRMTSRFMPYTDTSGQTWQARSGSLGSLRSTTSLEGKEIIGTEKDGLYQFSAIGVTGFRLDVPREASYRVRLLMAEGYWNAPRKRVFDVYAEDAPAATGVDIFAAVGRDTAHQVSFIVQVDDGRLDLRFVAKADLALVSAIEVIEVPAPVAPPSSTETPAAPVIAETFAHRMTAAPTELVDTAGRRWSRLGPSMGSARRQNHLIGKEVAGTDDDELYRRSVLGPTGILVPVPAPATYSVRLLMAEPYWTEPGERVVDVRAEGRVVASAVDLVADAGYGTAHDVTFDARVDDGMLTIDFVDLVDQPVVAGIEVTSTDPAAAVGLPSASLIPLGDSSVFHTDVSRAPVAPNSGPVMERLRAQIDAGKGWNAGVNAYRYNTAFYRATPATRRYTVGFYDCQRKGYVPDRLFDGPKYFVDVPIPDGAIPATGNDSQMGIYDPSTDRIWEFWQMRRTATGGWEACWGGRVDDLSSSDGTFPEPFGVTASGLVMAGGMVSIQEVARGEIDHALYLGVTEARELLYSFPANRTDGRSTGDDLLLEGQRLRLDPSVDVTTLGLTPFGEVVARAAQKYGFIVSDLAGSVSIATESGRQDERRTGLNPWDVLLGGPDWAALSNFPWDKVEVLPVDHGKAG